MQSQSLQNKIKDFILNQKAELLLLICGASLLYIIFSLISIDVLFAILICIGSFLTYGLVKWKKLREKSTYQFI